MAIAFDASSFDSWTSWTSHTLSHTCTGSDRLLVVTAYVGSSSDLVTWITYNWVSMTRISWLNNGSTESIYMYYLIDPATWANNIVATTSSSATVIMQNASYTGIKQSSQPDVSNTSSYTNSLTTQSTSVTTIADNCWTVWIFRTGTNQTVIAGTTFRTGVNLTLKIGDSNWPKTPAGSTSLGTTFASWFSAQIIASFAPSITANSNFFMFF